MAKLSINELTTYRWSFEKDVEHLAASGVDGIGVWRQKLSDFGDLKGVELLRENGLAVSSLSWAGGFTGSDGRTYKDSVADAREAVHQAVDLHADCLIVYSGARAGHTHSHARRLLKSALQEILELASEYDVTLAIEPMQASCAAGWTFLTDLRQTLDLIDSFDNPHLKMAIDAFHFGQDENLFEGLADIVPQTAIVQLGDAKHPSVGEQERCPLGKGNIPLDKIVASFLNEGYGGFFDVKLMGEEIEASDYSDLIDQSQRKFIDFVGTATASN